MPARVWAWGGMLRLRRCEEVVEGDADAHVDVKVRSSADWDKAQQVRSGDGRVGEEGRI